MLSLTTWGIYAAAYLDKVGEEAFSPLILLTFGNPILAIAGVIFTIKTIDMQPRGSWRIQFVASIVSAVLAVAALVVFWGA
ncbi:MAG TPA: hypothetical protein VGQ65_05105 [Thermoanaerobaculia bacterium]|jgi:hypothetical protein|nr:hypothetical protein [Thermoanaerobaculia bacterium]